MGQKVSMQQAADDFNVSTRTIRRYIASGRLRASRMGPRVIRIDVDDLATLFKPVGGGA
jgi:excisionase family DNA binding protein